MNIQYKDKAYSEVKTSTISELISHESSYDIFNNQLGELEEMNRHTDLSVRFNEKVLELLYHKGLLEENEITKLITDMFPHSIKEVKIVK